jgi:hypothetical protein
MNTFLIILACWLIPAFIGYIIIALESRSFAPDKRGVLLLVPILNIIILGLFFAQILERIVNYFR